MTHIRTRVHHRHLGRPIWLGHWAWSVIYSIWFASRRPTTVDRCKYISVSTGSASVSRGRVQPLLYALPWSSLGLRSHGLETGLSRWWRCVCGLMCITLRLSKHVVLLDEGPGDRRSDYFIGGDGNSVGLAEARDQRQKPQGPVGLI